MPVLDAVWRAAAYARREDLRTTFLPTWWLFRRRLLALVWRKLALVLGLATVLAVGLASFYSHSWWANGHVIEAPLWFRLAMFSSIPGLVMLWMAAALLMGFHLVTHHWPDGCCRPHGQFVIQGAALSVVLGLVWLFLCGLLTPWRWHMVAIHTRSAEGVVLASHYESMLPLLSAVLLLAATLAVMTWRMRRTDFLEHWNASTG